MQSYSQNNRNLNSSTSTGTSTTSSANANSSTHVHRKSIVASMTAPITTKAPPVVAPALSVSPTAAASSSGIAAGLQKLKLNNNGTVTTSTGEAAVLRVTGDGEPVVKDVNGAAVAALFELEATAENVAASELCMPVEMPR